jgi:hypothetical protein
VTQTLVFNLHDPRLRDNEKQELQRLSVELTKRDTGTAERKPTHPNAFWDGLPC